MFQRIQKRLDRYVTRRLKPQGQQADISRKTGLYILPTRYGWMLAAILLAMLLVAMNYNNSMVFLLVFFLGALAFLSMVHVHSNLSGLKLQAGPAPPVFAGEAAVFQLQISNPSERDRYAVAIRSATFSSTAVAVPAGKAVNISLPVATQQRGYLSAPRISSFTVFPFGLCKAWNWSHLAMRCLVYPEPAKTDRALPELASSGGQGAAQLQRNGDDLAGLREYQSGDSPRRIAWKASARGQALRSKQFEGAKQQDIALSFAQLAPQPVEARLAQLCRWVLDCEASGQAYALELPGKEIAAGQGAQHQQRCLRALALYGQA